MARYIISRREILSDFLIALIDHLIIVVNNSYFGAMGAVTDIVDLVTDTISTLFMIIIIPFFLFFMLKDHEKSTRAQPEYLQGN